MKLISIFLIIFCITNAQADQISDYSDHLKPEELVSKGFNMKRENGITTLTKNHAPGQSTILISKDGEYIAERTNVGSDKDPKSFNFAKVILVGPEGVEALTHCTGYYSEGKQFTCRTQTAQYCRSLTSQVSTSRFFNSDLRKLRECSKIIDNLKFDEQEVGKANAKALTVINGPLGIPNEEIANRVAKPISLKDLLEDHAACSIEKKWAPATSASKSPSPAKPSATTK